METVELPNNILPPHFKSWLSFYVHILEMHKKHGITLKKKIHFLEDDWENALPPGEGEKVVFQRTYKLKAIKRRAFDEVFAVLPTRREAVDAVRMAAELFNGGPGYELTKGWIGPLFDILPYNRP